MVGWGVGTQAKIPLSTKIQDVVFRVHQMPWLVPFKHEDCLKLYWILCKFGVRIKTLESGFGISNPDPFALFLVQFADPDHVQITSGSGIIRISCFDEFLTGLDPKIRIRARVSFGQLLTTVFDKIKQFRAIFHVNLDVQDFLNFQMVPYAVKKMRCRSRPEGPDPHIRLRPGTVRICDSGTALNYGSGI